MTEQRQQQINNNYKKKYETRNNSNHKRNRNGEQQSQRLQHFQNTTMDDMFFWKRIPVEPIHNCLDQSPGMSNICLLYASGFCKFGDLCPHLKRSPFVAHNSKFILQKEREWVNCCGIKAENRKISSMITINPHRSSFVPTKATTLPSTTFTTAAVRAAVANRHQIYKYCVILDLEGLPEISEFPCILLDLCIMKEISRYHAYVIPEQWMKDGIFVFDNANKNANSTSVSVSVSDSDSNDIGTFCANVDQKHFNRKSNAIPFAKVLSDFDQWLINNGVEVGMNSNNNGSLVSVPDVLFAICGNWDIAKQIPLQGYRCNIPPKLFNTKYAYFARWMNIKDFAVNFYNCDANTMTGMASVLRYLNIPLRGTHHLGMDDVSNITKCVMRYIKDGAVLTHTGIRDLNTGDIQFRYPARNRVGWQSRRGTSTSTSTRSHRRRNHNRNTDDRRGRGRGRGHRRDGVYNNNIDIVIQHGVNNGGKKKKNRKRRRRKHRPNHNT